MKILSRIADRQPTRETSRSQDTALSPSRPLRSIGRESSVVTLRSRDHAPSLYGANGVANAVDRTAPTALLVQLRQRLSDDYPDLRQEARQALEARLRSSYGVAIDADHTFFDSFAGGHSSSRSYSGWEHDEKPLTSVSLTDMQLRNFPADFGEDPNGLDANSGVYRCDAGTARFDAGNEVKLLSSELKQAIRSNDFQATYRAKVEAYWDRNQNAVALHYEALALEHSQDDSLSAAARTLLAQAAGYQGSGDSNWRAFAFDINSYASKNIAWLQAADGRVVLFAPHATQPLREYANVDDMRRGIATLARTPAGRDELLRGFSLYNQQDGVTYQGVEKWLGDIAAGGYDDRIAMRARRIEGPLFAELAKRTRTASLDDISRLIRSNDDISKQETLQALRAFNDIIGNPLTQLGEAGYAFYAARTEGFPEDRREAATAAWVAGLSAAVMLLLDGAGKSLGRMEPAQSGLYFKPPTRLADGRLGYPLSPLDPPRPPGDRFPPRNGVIRWAGPPDHPGPGHAPAPPVMDQRMQQPPLDLRRRPEPVRYLEPSGALAHPRSDLPPGGGSNAALPVAMDLSQPFRSRAGDGAATSAAAMSGDRAVHINAAGLRERYDIDQLYGFQSIGGPRLMRRVAGLELNRHQGGIARMVDGDMLRTFRTIDAAQDAARSAGLQRYQLYRVSAEGLRAVSFQDNRLHNPLFHSLLLQLTPAAEMVRDPRARLRLRNELMLNAEQEVHLSTEGLDSERVTFLARSGLPR